MIGNYVNNYFITDVLCLHTAGRAYNTKTQPSVEGIVFSKAVIFKFLKDEEGVCV